MEIYNFMLKIRADEPVTDEQQFDIIDVVMDRLDVIGCDDVELEYLGKKEVSDND